MKLARTIFGSPSPQKEEEFYKSIGYTVRDEASVRTDGDWFRSGSETYALVFEVEDGEDVKKYIAKACVKIPVIPTFQDWLDRRSRIDAAGIQTPVLYSADSAIVVEEFVPFSLREAYAAASDENKAKLHKGYISTFVHLARQGFSPISLHDARSHGTDVVLVDFGEDLGAYDSSDQFSQMTELTAIIHAEQSFRRVVT